MTRQTKREKWTMPAWMEPYRERFTNTGGNTVEELMNNKSTLKENALMAIISSCCVAQVALLMNLYDKGELN